MTLRMTLLVLATGLFSAIWTQDRPAPKPVSKSTAIASAEPPAEPENFAYVASQVGFAIPMPEMPQDEAWMFNDCGMPLPVGIVPGEYRAVSSTGLVREFRLTLGDLETYLGSAKFVTRDIYETQTETLRWYFIRVQTESGEVLPVIAERGGHIYLPAIAERSEAKRLERQASEIIVNAGRNLAGRVLRLVGEDAPLRISTEAKEGIRL